MACFPQRLLHNVLYTHTLHQHTHSGWLYATIAFIFNIKTDAGLRIVFYSYKLFSIFFKKFHFKKFIYRILTYTQPLSQSLLSTRFYNTTNLLPNPKLFLQIPALANVLIICSKPFEVINMQVFVFSP